MSMRLNRIQILWKGVLRMLQCSVDDCRRTWEEVWFVISFSFVWSNYHGLIYPTEHLQYFKICFWLREKCSGLLECNGKVADAENVSEKGVSDFYSYWNTSYFSALCQPFVCLWLCSQPTCLQLGKVRKLLCRSDRCIMTQICSEPPSQPAWLIQQRHVLLKACL